MSPSDARATLMIALAAPPASGMRTRSYHGLNIIACPRNVAPDPRTAMTCLPSGDQIGWTYSADTVVRRTGFAGALAVPTRAFQTWPRPVSSTVVKASHCPSGDHEGANSSGPKLAGVRRRGVPLGSDITHTRPIAWNASDLRSGEIVCQRRNFASNVLSF